MRLNDIIVAGMNSIKQLLIATMSHLPCKTQSLFGKLLLIPFNTTTIEKDIPALSYAHKLSLLDASVPGMENLSTITQDGHLV
jgi:hypothetical protein